MNSMRSPYDLPTPCLLIDRERALENIPSHICPTVNLYDEAYLVSEGRAVRKLPVACRGKSV